MTNEPGLAHDVPTLPPRSEAPTLPPRQTASNDPAVDRIEVPGYEILGQLGRGSMGVVYKARQVGLGRLVALKMLLSGAHTGAVQLARFRTEAEAIARLKHPNIVQIYEIGEHQGLPFFSLEYCAGGGLDKQLNGTPLPPMVAAAMVETLARAMHTAHRAGIVHRDLKPANILLVSGGVGSGELSDTPTTHHSPLTTHQPKITDFGLAKKLDESGDTKTGAVLGTPSYMPPEQAGGYSKGDSKPVQHPIGPCADIYSLGAILYECLTGRPPFKAASPMETVLQVVSEEPVPPRRLLPSLPHDIETICLKCLQKEPARRYQTAADLADDLQRFINGEPIKSRPVSRMERARRWCRRNPAVASLLATVFSLLLLTSVGAIVVALAFARMAERERKTAKEAAKLAEQERETAAKAAETAKRERETAEKEKLTAQKERETREELEKALKDLEKTRRLAEALSLLRGFAALDRPNMFRPYENRMEADEDFAKLKQAFDLWISQDDKPNVPLFARLMTAAIHKTNPDIVLARTILGRMPADAVIQLTPSELLPFMLTKVHFLGTSEVDLKEKVSTYVLILDRLDAATQELPPKDIYDNVVKPGWDASEKLRVNDGSEVGLRKQVAKLCGRKADMLGFYEEIGGDNPNYKEISGLYERALRLTTDMQDKIRAEYFASRGFAVALQSYAAGKAIDEKSMEDDFKESKRIDPTCPFPYLYRGAYFHMIQAPKGMGKPAVQRGYLEQAVNEYEQAIDANDRGSTVSPERAQQYTLLTNHSDALVKLAHIDPANHRNYLERAVASATKALELKNSRSPELAYASLGIALEDLAFLAGQTDKYKDAIACFERARILINKGKKEKAPGYWINLARAMYRSAEYAEPNQRFLQDASTMLNQVVSKMQPSIPEKAQALYYQGKIAAALDQYDEAEKAFVDVIALGKDRTARDFVEMAQVASAELAVKRAGKLEGRGKEADAFLSAASKRAEELKQADPREAARIRGLGYEMQHLPVEALKEFDTGLKWKPWEREAHIKLALARLNLLLDVRWKPKLGNKKPVPAELIQQARDLLKLCGETVLDAMLRGEAHGLMARAVLDAIDLDNPIKQKAQRQAAADELLTAAQLTPLHQPNGWRWRYELAMQFKSLMDLETDLPKKREYRELARKWAADATNGKATDRDKTAIQALIDNLPGGLWIPQATPDQPARPGGREPEAGVPPAPRDK